MFSYRACRFGTYLHNALREYNQQYSCNRKLYDEETAPDGIEISEAGGVYEHNLGGINFIGVVVKPFLQ